MIIISPSVLSADFAHLADELKSVKESGAEWLHFDVMDGQFVPNISFGVPVLKSVRKVTDLFLDVHLMIVDPKRFVKSFCDAGADMVTVHVESASESDIHEALSIIKSCGKKCGIVVKPNTPAESIKEYISDIDMVLVMTVEPGFGGQSFMYEQMGKVSKIREMIDTYNPKCRLEVDGGINSETAMIARNAGADVFVAGTFFFSAKDRSEAVRLLKGEK